MLARYGLLDCGGGDTALVMSICAGLGSLTPEFFGSLLPEAFGSSDGELLLEDDMVDYRWYRREDKGMKWVGNAQF